MPPDPAKSALTCARQNLWLIVLVALCGATWTLRHGYVGLRHDAILYSLQGLARLYPALANDVFLRFGSQDQYTLFGAVYAYAIQWIGLEPAAAILTFASHVALIFCAVLLLRQLTPNPTLVSLGAVVLIAIDGTYGSKQVFAVIEGFVTPRMPAEVLVLGGLTAACSARPRLAWALLAARGIIHPIIAAAGIVVLVLYYIGRRWPRYTAAAIGAGLLLLWVAGFVMPQGRWGTFDPDWLALVRERSPFLFLSDWYVDDWGRNAIPLATLVVGTVVLAEERARVLCRTVLFAALTGLALTLVAGDGAKLVLVTQLQPWRWLWLAVTVAALLLPAIAAAGWNRSLAGRITVALLAAAWWFESDLTALVSSLMAVTSLALNRCSDRRELRWALYGAFALAAIALVYRVATNLEFQQLYYMDWHTPLWIRLTSCVASGGTLSMAVMLGAAWLTRYRHGTAALTALAAVLIAVCLGQVSDSWGRWSANRFPPAAIDALAPWRALLPPDAEVFWSEEPLATWELLQRPSYISVVQSAGNLFSRTTAMELVRRVQGLKDVVPPRAFFDFDVLQGAGVAPSPEQQEAVCAAAPSLFLVASGPMRWAPIARVSRAMRHSLGALALYRCSDRTR